ncbi:putative Karyogamy protein [Seiridium unicorne]|uniref:Karyogamy protein n=1 Tax=Seiridium unicorne TaxID=138068 RepID=A0ABR2V502_9PEZI
MTGPAVTADPAASARLSPHLPAATVPADGCVKVTDQHHVGPVPPPSILTFSDVPSDLTQLGPLEPPQRHIDSSTDNNSSISSSTALPPVRPTSRHNPRKPSPGLAARLKALGFGGGQRHSSAPSTHTYEHIGRLPEDQLRSIDEKHQASSSAGEIVERRGRAWKGAGAPLQLLRSRSSRSSLRSLRKVEEDDLEVDQSVALKPELPEILAAPPLEMDTNKYRLPDHTNGNGTKALSDTRREHIERDVRLQDQENQTPPPPPPKDTPPGGTAPSEFTPDAASYFNPLGLQRPGSIYTISRLSFANQLAQLTSLQLPDAETLSGKISAIPTAQAAAKALINAAEQIRMWISKATEVIGGLDSDGDVEWAAAGGREGYEEVESLVTRFEELINVYVGAIEELQSRGDIASVTSDDLQRAVTQMESILGEWAKIRSTLKVAKGQIEIAMEWEELWNSVLGEIQNEMDDLCRLVFEMEERRHMSLLAVANGDGVDIGDLETIVEETPPPATRNNRISLPAFPLSPVSPATPTLNQDDSSLLALFARMQPLKASLDFLPMRLSVFETRAEGVFPSACEELSDRRVALEESYRKLEKDAESVRKELGEDKWVLVFRGAGRQAQKMYESVERSVSKLREAVDSGMHLTNPAALTKKIESYEAKKTHYGPAIERVLSIIDKGVKDRLTVNGEILRLHTDMQSKWEDVKSQIRDLDSTLEEIQADKRGQTLRDSISSMLSNDRSTIASGRETPGSSPPSSVIMSSLGLEPVTPLANKKPRSVSTGSHLPQPSSSRRSLAPPSQIARKPLGSRISTLSSPSVTSTPPRSSSATPLGNRIPRSVSNMADNRPRWNSSISSRDNDTGHNFKPLTLTTPSPYAKRSPTPVRSTSSLTPNSSQNSKLPVLRSPLSRAGTVSPTPEATPSRLSTSRLSFRDRVSSPGPYAQHTLAKPRLPSQASLSASSNNRRASLQPPRAQAQDAMTRSASSMAASRRTSLLPQPKGKTESTTGRHSPQALAGARSAMRKLSSGAKEDPKDNKPRWRF